MTERFPRAGRPKLPSALVHVPMIAMMVLAAALRLVSVGSAYDYFIDEGFYLGLGTSVRQGHIPPHVPPGWGNTSQAFLLHPPGFFVLLAIWQTVTRPRGDIFQQLYVARGLNIALAVVTTGLLYCLGRRLGGWRTGFVAALLFALDPFILRQNGRLLLETATLTWVVAGFLVLIGLAQGRSRHPRGAAAAAGLLFGAAILTKDMASIETLGALVVLAIFGWGIPRRLAVMSAVFSIIPYTIYVGSCAAQGLLVPLWLAKSYDLRRMLGLVQITGFNRPGSVSLASTLWSDIGSFGLSYLLVALGVLAAVVLLRSARQDYKVVGVFVASAAALLGYAVCFGTIEEQFLYFLSVPAVISVSVVGTEAYRRMGLAGQGRSRGRVVLVSLLVAACGWNLAVWAQTRTVPDNGNQRAVAWIGSHVPRTSTLAVSVAGISTTIPANGPRVVIVGAPSQMAGDHVLYLVLETRLVEGDYCYLSKSAAAWYERHANVVFSFHDRSSGDLEILKPKDPRQW